MCCKDGTVKKTTEQRFWAKVNKSHGLGPKGTCWEWIGARKPTGYGTFWDGKRTTSAHQFAYRLRFGHTSKQVLHKCDWPPCVRLSHLRAGSNLDNRRDSVRKRRTAKGPTNFQSKKTHCAKGHPYSKENTSWRTTPEGYRRRECRVCHRAYDKAHKKMKWLHIC